MPSQYMDSSALGTDLSRCLLFVSVLVFLFNSGSCVGYEDYDTYLEYGDGPSNNGMEVAKRDPVLSPREDALLRRFKMMLFYAKHLSQNSPRMMDPGSKRIGSEFVGKRNVDLLQHPMNDVNDDDFRTKRLGSEFLGKRMGSEFLGKRKFWGGKRIGSEFVGKRMGSEFLGKRLGSEFVGKRSSSSTDMEVPSEENLGKTNDRTTS